MRRLWWSACSVAVLLLTGVEAFAPRSMARAESPSLLATATRDYQAALDAANRDERLLRFRRAQASFAAVIQQRQARSKRPGLDNVSPDLWVNWGNAALGAEDLGTAVLAYRRAIRLDPDHLRAWRNLRHARSLLPEWAPRPDDNSLFSTVWSWATRLTTQERRAASAAMFFVSAALAAGAIRWRRPVLRNLAVGAGMIWLGLMVFPVIDWGVAAEGVVTAPEVIVRAADSVRAPARFPQPLPAGVEVITLECRDAWRRIQLADGRDGWVPDSTVEMVVPPGA